ncbi:hypothetical protein TeGR_g9462 [Tetraparma gracilis]|uniref:Uncharacterized protein n=1 Tax=Tetraparma gracilis TaxID=2962635 RepID=A0ABQ6N7Y1_9STRA|nr:hypothetical protein TeGR_g9462 [Tetraparma gracilis]
MEILNEKIQDMIRMMNVLRSAQAKYRFFDEFLFHIIRNAMKRGAVQTKFTVKTHLVALTANEAGRIARSLVSILMANATAEAAVDEHIMTFPALGELEREFMWFRPMMAAIATELMGRVAYGVRARAAIGAGASFGDMISDAYMVKVYLDTGRPGTAYALLGMVGACLFFQVTVNYLQNHNLKKNKWKTMFFETLTIISFAKPGIDAYRVASGAESPPGATTDPLTTMVYNKVGELVFEAVPGLVLQLVAVLTTDEVTTSAYVSLLISTASAAFTGTTMFWDIDTDPGKRKGSPDWIGLVPDLGRGTAFAAIFSICALQIFAKAAATALLIVTNSAWLWYYVLGDHGLHFAYRIARRDFVYFEPAPATFSYAVAPFFRVMLKVVCDFTGSPVLRLPLLLGGSYYTWCLASSQVSVFAAVFLYGRYAEPPEGVNKLDASFLWTGAIALAGAWLCAFLFFALRIAVPKYRHTLWSSTSGRQCAQDYFNTGKGDEGKFQIYTNNLLLWESDIGEEVKAWTAENWARWKEEKPAWFKPESVPDQFIPAGELQQLGQNRKRRGSAAGSVRESFREGGGGEE